MFSESVYKKSKLYLKFKLDRKKLNHDNECVVCFNFTSENFFPCKHLTCIDCFLQIEKLVCPYCRIKNADESISLIRKHGVFIAMSYYIDQMNVSKIALMYSAKRYGTSLKFALYQDEDIALTAVKNSGLAIHYVFEHLQTENVCLTAINQNSKSFASIKRRKQTNYICKYALQRNGLMLKYVVKKFKSLENSLIAVKQNGMALKYVQNQTKEICICAILQNPAAFKYINSIFFSQN